VVDSLHAAFLRTVGIMVEKSLLMGLIGSDLRRLFNACVPRESSMCASGAELRIARK
jgi:hypothetical protein